MKTAVKTFIGALAVPLFLTFIILATLRFEVLNKSYLFGVFEKHKIYEKLPVVLADSLPPEYAEFAKNISPQVIKPLIEDNLTQIIDFINGDSKDIVLSFALNGVGFENSTGISWSPPESIKSVNGAGNIMIIALVIILAILAGLFFLEGKVILLIGGIYITAISVIIKLGLLVIGNELTKGPDPSQKLLGLLAASLFPEITTTWLILGILLILLWIILKIRTHTA